MADGAAVRDFDGLYKALLEAHPRESLDLLCGAKLDGAEVILDAPTEQLRLRSRQCDKVFLVPHGDDVPADVYHVEGRFRRDQEQLDYLSVNVPDDLDAEMLLSGPLAALALWSREPPADVVERVVDRIAETTAIEEQLVQIELGMPAGVSLATQLLDAMRRRGMNNILKQSESGREIREEGRELGLIDAMRALLRARYGDFTDLDALARRLVERDDNDETIARIVGGATLDELRHLT